MRGYLIRVISFFNSHIYRWLCQSDFGTSDNDQPTLGFRGFNTNGCNSQISCRSANFNIVQFRCSMVSMACKSRHQTSGFCQSTMCLNIFPSHLHYSRSKCCWTYNFCIFISKLHNHTHHNDFESSTCDHFLFASCITFSGRIFVAYQRLLY